MVSTSNIEGLKMKKRLTLNYVWAECIKMYTYVVKKRKAGDTRSVSDLKTVWVNRHGYKSNKLNSDCFFCEYDERRMPSPRINCASCPGKLVDSSFHCTNAQFIWCKYPDFFLKEIIRLDAIRRAR